jgi:hypothetical protein
MTNFVDQVPCNSRLLQPQPVRPRGDRLPEHMLARTLADIKHELATLRVNAGGHWNPRWRGRVVTKDVIDLPGVWQGGSFKVK